MLRRYAPSGHIHEYWPCPAAGRNRRHLDTEYLQAAAWATRHYGVGYALQEVDDRFDDLSEQGDSPKYDPMIRTGAAGLSWVASRETGRPTDPRTTSTFKSGGTRVNADASVSILSYASRGVR